MFVCRACLATGVKLYNIHKKGLADKLAVLVDIPQSPTDGLPPYLCKVCTHLLQKFKRYRDKCRKSMQILKRQNPNNRVTTEHINNLEGQVHLHSKPPITENNILGPKKRELVLTPIINVDIFGICNDEKLKNSVTFSEKNPSNDETTRVEIKDETDDTETVDQIRKTRIFYEDEVDEKIIDVNVVIKIDNEGSIPEEAVTVTHDKIETITPVRCYKKRVTRKNIITEIEDLAKKSRNETKSKGNDVGDDKDMTKCYNEVSIPEDTATVRPKAIILNGLFESQENDIIKATESNTKESPYVKIVKLDNLKELTEANNDVQQKDMHKENGDKSKSEEIVIDILYTSNNKKPAIIQNTGNILGTEKCTAELSDINKVTAIKNNRRKDGMNVEPKKIILNKLFKSQEIGTTKATKDNNRETAYSVIGNPLNLNKITESNNGIKQSDICKKNRDESKSEESFINILCESSNDGTVTVTPEKLNIIINTQIQQSTNATLETETAASNLRNMEKVVMKRKNTEKEDIAETKSKQRFLGEDDVTISNNEVEITESPVTVKPKQIILNGLPEAVPLGRNIASEGDNRLKCYTKLVKLDKVTKVSNDKQIDMWKKIRDESKSEGTVIDIEQTINTVEIETPAELSLLEAKESNEETNNKGRVFDEVSIPEDPLAAKPKRILLNSLLKPSRNSLLKPPKNTDKTKGATRKLQAAYAKLVKLSDFRRLLKENLKMQREMLKENRDKPESLDSVRDVVNKSPNKLSNNDKTVSKKPEKIFDRLVETLENEDNKGAKGKAARLKIVSLAHLKRPKKKPYKPQPKVKKIEPWRKDEKTFMILQNNYEYFPFSRRALIRKIKRIMIHLDEVSNKYNVEVKCLTKDEQRQEMDAMKERYKYTNHQCLICYRGFALRRSYTQHMLGHDQAAGEFECDFCHLRYKRNGLRSRHMEKFHYYRFTCKNCGKSYKSVTMLIKHSKSHNDDYPFTCEQCGKRMRHRNNYSDHMRMVHKKDAAHCALCGGSYTGESGLNVHMAIMHKQAVRCNSCDLHFEDKTALIKHLRNSTDGACDPKTKACSKCGRGFKTAAKLTEHKRQHALNMFKCEKCGKSFESTRAFYCHLSATHSNKNKAVEPSARPKRKYSCPSNQQFICELCGKLLKGYNSLVTHLHLHTGEKPHQCPHCPKRFSMQLHLKMHTMTHTDERPYTCSLCPAAFRQGAHLHTHMRTHTQEKPYKCDVCRKCFATKGNMRIHIKNVHMGLPRRRLKASRFN